MEFQYNKNYNLISKIEYNGFDELTNKEVFEYNEHKQIIKEITYDSEGKMSNQQTFTYFPTYLLQQTIDLISKWDFNNLSNNEKVTEHYEYKTQFYKIKLPNKLKLIEFTEDVMGEGPHSTVLEYDQSNRLISESWYKSNIESISQSFPYWNRRYEYTKNEIKEYSFDQLLSVSTYTDDRIQKELFFDNHGEPQLLKVYSYEMNNH